MKRRNFLEQSILVGGSLVLPNWAFAGETNDQKLVILHTNDVHSRIDAFPMDGSRYQGMGGVAARSALITSIRKHEPHVLLLDSGDIFQGTPYFNFYKGKVEIDAMTKMQYDASTVGNHDFDGGLENLATQLQGASFSMIICNYDFSRTPMESVCLPYKTITKGKLKIGILGLGIEMKGLVPDQLFGETIYLDPVEQANKTAYLLKYKEKCDLIICLSHLGYRYDKERKIDDLGLAAQTEFIDVILGGHTHTFLNTPDVVTNKRGNQVIVNQVGWGGIVLGRIDLVFDHVNKQKFFNSTNMAIGGK